MKGRDEQLKDLYYHVGEVVLWTSLLDDQLTKICIALMDLPDSPLLGPVVSSIELTRKAGILKAFVDKLGPKKDWRIPLHKYLDDVERVNQIRNGASHGIIGFDPSGLVVLSPPAATNLLRSLDVDKGTFKHFGLLDIEAACDLAQITHASGVKILDTLASLIAEMKQQGTELSPQDSGCRQ